MWSANIKTDEHVSSLTQDPNRSLSQNLDDTKKASPSKALQRILQDWFDDLVMSPCKSGDGQVDLQAKLAYAEH